MSVLHVVNGDSTRVLLERARLEGDIVVYADILHEGPATDDVETRARFLSGAAFGEYHEILRQLTSWRDGVASHRAYDDVVLWFEHDLFDQLLLLRHLAFFAREGRTEGLWLICTDRYLGMLSPQELAGL